MRVGGQNSSRCVHGVRAVYGVRIVRRPKDILLGGPETDLSSLTELGDTGTQVPNPTLAEGCPENLNGWDPVRYGLTVV